MLRTVIATITLVAAGSISYAQKFELGIHTGVSHSRMKVSNTNMTSVRVAVSEGYNVCKHFQLGVMVDYYRIPYYENITPVLFDLYPSINNPDRPSAWGSDGYRAVLSCKAFANMKFNIGKKLTAYAGTSGGYVTTFEPKGEVRRYTMPDDGYVLGAQAGMKLKVSKSISVGLGMGIDRLSLHSGGNLTYYPQLDNTRANTVHYTYPVTTGVTIGL